MLKRSGWLSAALVSGLVFVACGGDSNGNVGQGDESDSGESSGDSGKSGSSSSGKSGAATTGSSGKSGASGAATTGSSGSGKSGGATSGRGDASAESGKVIGDAGGPPWPAGRNNGACRPKFGSGVNVAWFSFARDVPNPAIAKFTDLYKNSVAVGGRVIRWWYHTNGAVTPGYDANGMAKPISEAEIADVRKILDAAVEEGAVIDISIWTHNMLDANAGAAITNNKALLEVDENRQAYIDNVLKPLVTALKGHKGIYAWEIFNEAEGMTEEYGWTKIRTKQKFITKTVNWLADAIHEADPDVPVTNGAWTFIANSDVVDTNYYSDKSLIAEGGRAGGTLDFYQVHYYDNWGEGNDTSIVSPFKHPASYWKLDKPIVVGEFWVIDTLGLPANELFTNLYEGGYAGAWAWQYANADNPGPTTPTKWPTMQAPMKALYDAHKADLDCAE